MPPQIFMCQGPAYPSGPTEHCGDIFILALLTNHCYLHYAFPNPIFSRDGREASQVNGWIPYKKSHPTEDSHRQIFKAWYPSHLQ